MVDSTYIETVELSINEEGDGVERTEGIDEKGEMDDDDDDDDRMRESFEEG